MSSLRPDNRNGRSGRSNSRTRDTSRNRSAVRDESSKSKSKPKSKSKTGKVARFEEDDDGTDEASNARNSLRGPAFDGDEPRTSKRSKHRGLFGSDEENDEESSTDEELVNSRRPSRRTFEDDDDDRVRTRMSVRAPRSDDEDESRVSRRSKGRSRVKDDSPRTRTSARIPAYADEDTSIAMPTMPGGFDDDPALAYGEKSSRKPGLSSLLGGRRDETESGSATSSESDDARRRRRKQRRRNEARHGSDIRAPKDSKHRKSSRHDSSSQVVPYPASNDSIMPQWPPDEGRGSKNTFSGYADPAPYKYAEPPEHLTYTANPNASKTDHFHSKVSQKPRGPGRSISFSQEADVKEVKPSEERSTRLSVGGSKHDKRAPSPLPGSRMDRLSVSGGSKSESRSKGADGAPPASPLLEAYHGTYQSISPMPSPMMRPEDDLDDLPSLSLSADEGDHDLKLTRPRSKSEVKVKKKVKLYDAEGDADKLAKAMNHREAKTGPLMEVLPELTHDQLLALREEYKKRVKVQGRGVNISKQIKATTTGNFGKICYVTALGRWESESYWANFWYQSHSSNRELLIEALIGRSNADIREINDSFKDKRYQDSLSLCMEKELKPDKFRTAILTALEGRRQEETDTWPTEYRNRDVETLYRALKSKEGGESAILDIVIRRSGNHLREVLKVYERVHGANFARQALAKSNNLVGEVIAHVLNGAINQPARDCLLVRHAVNDVSSKNKEVDLRYELLMSRLIRLHWDRLHLARVKEDYKQKYRVDLERSVQEATKGDFGTFCLRLCET